MTAVSLCCGLLQRLCSCRSRTFSPNRLEGGLRIADVKEEENGGEVRGLRVRVRVVCPQTAKAKRSLAAFGSAALAQ